MENRLRHCKYCGAQLEKKLCEVGQKFRRNYCDNGFCSIEGGKRSRIEYNKRLKLYKPPVIEIDQRKYCMVCRRLLLPEINKYNNKFCSHGCKQEYIETIQIAVSKLK